MVLFPVDVATSPHVHRMAARGCTFLLSLVAPSAISVCLCIALGALFYCMSYLINRLMPREESMAASKQLQSSFLIEVPGEPSEEGQLYELNRFLLTVASTLEVASPNAWMLTLIIPYSSIVASLVLLGVESDQPLAV